ncbi:hypothetical protein [Nonomuraea sp. SYSU D8015]|nr:hypothetical protein [Nonomuraea sp. SYSU D8015]
MVALVAWGALADRHGERLILGLGVGLIVLHWFQPPERGVAMGLRQGP